MQPADQIKAQALELGFAAVGIAPVDQLHTAARGLNAFLVDGRHGDMAWMVEKQDRRADPLVLWPEAKSIIAVGMNYGPEENPMDQNPPADTGVISVYARGKDYHDVLKKRLKRLARWMAERFEEDVKVFVDTAPVMEKPLAALAGIGWQGKHTNLVSRDWGSWLFLGAIYTTMELPKDAPHTDHCGDCNACIDACPTGALTAPYEMDARKCISYLSIEHRSSIDETLRGDMGDHIYGCDDCLSVCPWNKFAKPTLEAAFAPREGLSQPSLGKLLKLDDAGFRAMFAGSPIKRTGRDRFVRNALIAAGNSGQRDLAPLIKDLMSDPSPLVADAANWAMVKLDAP